MDKNHQGAIDFEKLGMIAAEAERGAFTVHGYILPTGDEWMPYFEKNRSVPAAYRITGAEVRPSVKERLNSPKSRLPESPKHKHGTPDNER